MLDGAGWRDQAQCAWVERWNSFCVAFVEGAAPEAVLQKMVGDSATGIVSVAEAREWASEQTVPNDRSVIEAGVGGGCVVTVEANGYHATLPEVVARISKGSRAIVAFRNVHGHTSFLYAVDGAVVRSFDPLVYDDPPPWDGPPLPEEAGLDFGSGHPMASVFVCAECLTRFRLTPEMLDDHGDSVVIGHHPLHSLAGAASWRADMVNAEGELCEDARRQSIPNRLLSLLAGDDLDADDLFVPGWIGWIQFALMLHRRTSTNRCRNRGWGWLSG